MRGKKGLPDLAIGVMNTLAFEKEGKRAICQL
jgi:hypothetical protein